MCRTIAFINQKGGVAKTTSTFNVAYELSNKGMSVLVIDYDPQGNLSMCCGIEYPDDLPITMATYMERQSLAMKENEPSGIVTTSHGFDLIPSGTSLSGIEYRLSETALKEEILKKLLAEVVDQYAFILIDCMPSLGLLSINALVACDEVIIPTTADYMSIKGLEMLLSTIASVKRRLNRSLRITGVVFTMAEERTTLSKQMIELVVKTYGGRLHVFKAMIPKSVKVAEANAHSQPIGKYHPKHKVAEAYRLLVEEVLHG